MAVSRKDNKAQPGPNLERIEVLVERIESKAQQAADVRGDLGATFKEAEDLGYNRPALKLAIKLRNMEQAKRSDFLSSLNTYCDALGVFAQKDLFSDEEQGVGPSRSPDIDPYQAGKKAGFVGAPVDKNPHDDGTESAGDWRKGWYEGQAQLLRSTMAEATA